MNDKNLCELCERRPGKYSSVRRIRICTDCWYVMGLQESRFNSAMAQDLTGQDAERE